MSSGILFRTFCVSFPVVEAVAAIHQLCGDLPEPVVEPRGMVLLAQFSETGSSNTTMFSRSGREVLARDWGFPCVGHPSSIIRRACMDAIYAEKGMTRYRGRAIKAENYIRIVRKAVDSPIPYKASVPTLCGERLGVSIPSDPLDDYFARHWLAVARDEGRIGEDFLTLSSDPALLPADMLLLAEIMRYAGDYPWIRSRINPSAYLKA